MLRTIEIEPDHLVDGSTAGAVDESIAALVHHAVEDARELASAEIALYRAKVSERVSAYTSAAIFFGAAGVLALSAVTALLVGLILSLATLIGPLGATAVVIVVTLIIAGILGMIGKGKLAPATGAATEKAGA